MMRKKSLIIGGHRGIGKSIYINLKKRGDEIFCVSRSTIKKKNFITADITNKIDQDKISNFFKKIKIDNLIFAQRYRGDDSEEEYKVILKATTNIIKNIKFKKNGSSIIILGSIASTTVIGDQDDVYHLTRGALETLTKYYAFKLGTNKTRVNCIQPTKIFKPENKSFFSKKNNLDRRLIEKITPLSRMGTSDDIANLVEFLTSEKSSYITGTIIPVDGGLRLVGQEQIAKMFRK